MMIVIMQKINYELLSLVWFLLQQHDFLGQLVD